MNTFNQVFTGSKHAEKQIESQTLCLRQLEISTEKLA